MASTGACHLGATVGVEEFKDNYAKLKVKVNDRETGEVVKN